MEIKTQNRMPQVPMKSVMFFESPVPECLVTTFGAGASKFPISKRLGKRKSKCSHNENKILRE